LSLRWAPSCSCRASSNWRHRPRLCHKQSRGAGPMALSGEANPALRHSPAASALRGRASAGSPS
jgi:hypothetical protein